MIIADKTLWFLMNSQMMYRIPQTGTDIKAPMRTTTFKAMMKAKINKIAHIVILPSILLSKCNVIHILYHKLTKMLIFWDNL